MQKQEKTKKRKRRKSIISTPVSVNSKTAERQGVLQELVRRKHKKKQMARMPLLNQDCTRIKKAVTGGKTVEEQFTESPKRKKKKSDFARIPYQMPSTIEPTTSSGFPSKVDRHPTSVHLLSDSSNSEDDCKIMTPKAPKISSDSLRQKVKEDFEKKRCGAKTPKSKFNAKKRLDY